jgi:hypothetical protein
MNGDFDFPDRFIVDGKIGEVVWRRAT